MTDNKIFVLLQNLSDQELSYFYKFRLTQYSVDTQNEIVKYIFTFRKLTAEKITELSTNKIGNVRGCKRCGADKFFNYELDYDSINLKPLGRYSTEEYRDASSSNFIKINQQECLVCGHKVKNYVKVKRIVLIIVTIIIIFILKAYF